MTAKQDQTALIKIIGARFKAARELCNLSQKEAARRMGYCNSTKLSKVERAADTKSVPLWLILRASQVYEVSVDYLFGLSDDWETGSVKTQERMVSRWLYGHFNQCRNRDIEALKALNAKLNRISESIYNISNGVNDFFLTVADFRKANPWFDNEARLGARFVNKLDNVKMLADKSISDLKRFQLECRLSSFDPQGNQRQFDFMGEENDDNKEQGDGREGRQ